MSFFAHKAVRVIFVLVAVAFAVLVTVLWGWEEHEQRTVKAVQSSLDDHASSLVLEIVNQDEAAVAAVKALSNNDNFGEAVRNGNEELVTTWIQSLVDVGNLQGIGVKKHNPEGFWAVGSLTSDARALLDDATQETKNGYTDGEGLLAAHKAMVMLNVSQDVMEVAGSVVVEADLSSDVLLSRAGNGTVVTAVHSNGTVLDSGTSTPFSKMGLAAEVKKVVAFQRPTAFTYTNENGDFFVGVFRPVPAREYGILIEVPYETIFSEKGTYRYFLGAGTVILLILGAGFGNIFNKSD